MRNGWSAHGAIRARREALGFSQTQLADSLGVTKSLLSLIESGKRQPTEDQIAILADTLRLPPDLLLLGAGRLPDDVRGVFESDAAAAVTAIRHVAGARAVELPTSPNRIPMPRSIGAPELHVQVPERIDVTKTSASYRAHSYHTKVPPEAIRPLIRAFTRPGELVMDSFCGSGMTGVAALMEGRNALLSDLSPAAVHIASNYTRPCDPAEFQAALAEVARELSPTIAWLYRPIGSDSMVEYTTWSDIHRCPSTGRDTLYWDLVQTNAIEDGDRIRCPHCKDLHRKSDLLWVGERPVESHVSAGSNRISRHSPTEAELALYQEAEGAPIPYWTPDVPFSADREMWRASHRNMGITTVNGFFTRRNLHALAALRHSIVRRSSGRVREALLFAFTAAVNRASRRYQWNAKRPTNVMTGTLYISSLRYEWNVWSLFRRKAADVLRYFQAFPKTEATVEVIHRSATDLSCIPDGSIDMVFVDPPFGANIFYADSSLLWDAWLGHLTDPASEIVINKQRTPAEGGKRLQDYADLMQRSFGEAARVLKKGGRAVLAFSNADDEVWSSVQDALASAGFRTSTVHVLNKGQPSIKGVKGVTGRESVTTLDLLLCLEHRSMHVCGGTGTPPPFGFVDQQIRDAVNCADLAVKRTDEVYSFVIRAAIAAGYSVTGITMPEVVRRCESLGYIEINGLWSRADSVGDHPRDFVSGYLAAPSSLPKSTRKSSPTSAPVAHSVSGGRNSALYLAHSYHTKVPPEAITPFIEHFTKPNDVVLDPFCGSGMTGVAATLARRRAILNDLSPAAVHLAWNHTRPCDPSSLRDAFHRMEARVEGRLSALYKTKDANGKEARIQWTLWSTKHACPECKRKFLLWEAMDRETGRLGKTIQCPRCNETLSRSKLDNLGSEPAWIAGESGNGKRFEKEPSQTDIRHAMGFRRGQISTWFPDGRVDSDREMFIRCALQLQGIETIADFYTPRNLEALSLIWEAITAEQDDRLRRALAFAFTNTAWHGTRMRRFNARGGQRPLTGTLYIPQLSSEANVLEVMRHKIEQLGRYYQSYDAKTDVLPAVLLGSATHLSGVESESVDYVFTDPPFGSNIFYADCNLIWESWLGRLTNDAQEAVVNRSRPIARGGRSLSTYGDLMGAAMNEIARVLKPGGWATVVFHNTDAEVWKAIRDAASSAGFTFHQAGSLDRKQQSHKGYKGRSGEEDVAHFDVVFNLRKSPQSRRRRTSKEPQPVALRRIIDEVRNEPSIVRRGLQGVHAEVMRRLASTGAESFVDYAEIRRIWEEAHPMQQDLLAEESL